MSATLCAAQERKAIRAVILGAGGRDFHNFNTFFRDNPFYEVVAFTATQIPFIANRIYPPTLSGPHYPDGIPIYPEEDLPRLILDRKVREVFFSYSDISHEELMDKASLILSMGADFRLLGPEVTMIERRVPVLSVCAVRTGCGKSVITRKIGRWLRGKGLRVVVIRHPMAYCSFKPVLRFGSMKDIDSEACTIEEREEFEPLVEAGIMVYAGIDYELVLREAEGEAEVIVWDGGNNDFPFVRPDFEIVLLDALRPGHERLYFPGEVNLRRGDLLIITKVNEAKEASLETIRRNIAKMNPKAPIVMAPSILELDRPDLVQGKRVLVIEDGPTVTHGGMPDGAGAAASRKWARQLIDPRGFAVGSLQTVFEQYPHIGCVLPAMGYSEEQIRELAETIHRSEAEAVVIGTPTDLRKRIRIEAPTARVVYDFDVDLSPWLEGFLRRYGLSGS